MKKIFTLLLLMASLVGFSQSTTVVISQVYSGGGSSTAGTTYKNDYVELFNKSSVTQDISGFSLQYGSATGNFGNSATAIFTIPDGTILQPGKYYLVQLGSAGTAGADLPVTPDAVTSNIAMGAANGKIALVSNNTALGCGGTTACTLPNALIIDLVSYGTANNAEGGAAVGPLSTTTGAVRKTAGCTDTNNNFADFDVVTAPIPRNSATAANVCGGTTSPAISTTGTIADFGNVVISTNSTSQSFTVSGANLTGAPGNITVAAPSTDFQVSLDNTTWTATVSIPYTTATLAATTVHVRFSPQTVGVKTGNISITGGGTAAAVTVAVSGTGVAALVPTITTAGTISDFGSVVILTNSTSKSFTVSGADLTGAPGNITVTAPSTDFQVSLDNTTWTATVSIPYTTATLAATTVHVRFTPQTVGVKTGNISITGGGTAAAVTVAVSGTGITAGPPPTSGVRISQVYSGGGSSTAGTTYKYDYVELFNKSSVNQDISGFSLQYGSATGNFGSSATNMFTIPDNTILLAGQYYLVQFGSAGTAGADLPVTPDAVTSNIAMGAANGKIALVSNNTALGCGGNTGGNSPCTLPHALIIDLVSYGTANNAEGGAAVGALSTTTGAVRKTAGCTDTDNNLADFDVVTAPVPRNSATAANVCGSAASPAITTTGTIADFGNVVVLTNSTSQSFTVSGADLTGAPGNITVTAPSTDFQVSLDNTTWTATVSIPYTTATLAATTVHVRFTPQTVGVKTGNISITGGGTAAAVTVAVSGTGVAAATPSISTTGTIADFGNVVVLTNSTSQSFTVSGADLTGAPGNITVTAPSTDFQVSLDNTTWTATVSIPYTTATLAATTVHVRFTPQTVGVKTGNISITGGGTAAAVTVAVSGTGVAAATPVLTTTGTITDFGNVVILTNSASKSFSVSGANLTGAPGNITVTAPSTDFQVSLDNTTWTATVSIPYTTATLAATTVHVRFTPQTVGVKTGNISITGGGTAAAVTVAVSGTGVNAAPPASTNVRISQVYGAGGNAATSTYNQDYVELFNPGSTEVDISDWSIQYAAFAGPTGAGNWSAAIIPANTKIGAGKYFLVSFATASATNGVALPTPDLVGPTTINLSGTAGKVALVNTSTVLNGTTACNHASVVDMIGFSTTVNAASCSEGTAFVTTDIDNGKAMFRKNGGCTDTNNNSADFELGATAPRNSATAANVCGGSTSPAITTAGTVTNFGDVVILTNSTSQSFTVSGANLTGAPGNITVTAPSTDFQVSLDNTTWTATVSIPYTTATLAATTVHVRFTPQTLGVKTGNISITGGGTAAAVNVAVSGTGVTALVPTITTTGTVADFGSVVILTNSTSQSFTVSGANLTGAPGNITVTAPSTDFQVSLDNTTWTATVSIPYTTTTLAATTVHVRFTPQTVGVKTGNISITGGGTAAAVTVAVSGTGINAAPSAPAGVRISQVYGGGGNSSATFNQDYVELFNASATEVDISNWSVQYAAFAGPGGAGNWSAAVIPANTKIGAGKYFLIAFAEKTTTGADIPTADLVGPTTINLSGTAGKVALVNTSTQLNGTTACNHASVVDMFGFSTTVNVATCAEGTSFVSSGIDNGKAMFRKNGGCTDTNNNSADFELGATGPRNSATAANLCPVPAGLTTTGTIADYGEVVILTNSASQSFTVAGTGLTGAPGNITVTAPSTDFQVSLDNTTWAATATIPYTSAILAATTVHVRFTPQTIGVKTGSISIAGGGASTAVAVSGTGVNVNPSVLVAGPLTGFGNVCLNNTVGPNVVNLGGALLTTANVVVGPLAGYTFSTSAAGTYTSTLNITQPGGTFSQAIYVKFTPTAAQSYNGNIPVVGGGAYAINIPVTGAGINTAPVVVTNAASAIGLTTAQLNASITTVGCSDVTFYGFEYSTINGFANGTGTEIRTFNLAAGNYSTVLNGLAPNAVYYYKAYAQNLNGKTYGVQQSFTTGTVGSGLIVYSTPVQRGGTVHYSLDKIKNGHYATVLYNMAGQKVFRKEMIIQVGFINDRFKLPAYLPAGSYVLQIENYEFKVRKQILVK